MHSGPLSEYGPEGNLEKIPLGPSNPHKGLVCEMDVSMPFGQKENFSPITSPPTVYVYVESNEQSGRMWTTVFNHHASRGPQ